MSRRPTKKMRRQVKKKSTKQARPRVKVTAKQVDFVPGITVRLWAPEVGGKPTEVHICLKIGEKTLSLRFTTKEGLKNFIDTLGGASNAVWSPVAAVHGVADETSHLGLALDPAAERVPVGVADDGEIETGSVQAPASLIAAEKEPTLLEMIEAKRAEESFIKRVMHQELDEEERGEVPNIPSAPGGMA